jgi:hypothetical protein
MNKQTLKQLCNELKLMTVWMPIKDYPNYEVSICGQVRNKNTHRVLSQWINNSNYKYVTLSDNGITKKFNVHRLVLNNFVTPTDSSGNYVFVRFTKLFW